jgi:hypothetical protein
VHAIVEEHRAEVEQLCRQYRVRRLDVFGSAVRGGFDTEKSDLDFLVDFHPPGPGESWRRFFDLLHGLQDLFGRPIDLVEDSAIKNPYFRKSVDSTRELFYAG